MKYYHLILLSSFLIAACKLKNSDVTKDDSKEIWNKITLRWEGGTIIYLDNYDDSTLVKSFPIFNFFDRAPIKKNIKIFNVYYTPAEKDSIYKLTRDLIINPAKRNKFCTEYVGHLELYIDYSQFTLSGNYTSVCDWTTLSIKTQQLYALLKKRIKGVYLGHNQN